MDTKPDKHLAPASNELFFREGARYVCAKCHNKFFTKDEVIDCARSHAGESSEPEAASPQPQAAPQPRPAAPQPQAVSQPPAAPQPQAAAPGSVNVTLNFKPEILAKLNALAKGNNIPLASLIERIVLKMLDASAKK